jgi:hypothetical protein
MIIIYRTLALLLLTFVLSGCTTFQDIDDGLGKFRGKHIESLIDVIGYPTYQHTVGTHDLYIWDSDEQVSIAMPITTYTAGTVAPYDGSFNINSGTSTTTYVPQTFNLKCKISVEVDDEDKIINWQLEGDSSGCYQVAEALK